MYWRDVLTSLSLNEDSIWSGKALDRNQSGCVGKSGRKIREMLHMTGR